VSFSVRFCSLSVVCPRCSVSVRVSCLHILSGRGVLVGGGGSRFADLGGSTSVPSSGEFLSFSTCCFVF
jgi:hypothetical protein